MMESDTVHASEQPVDAEALAWRVERYFWSTRAIGPCDLSPFPLTRPLTT